MKTASLLALLCALSLGTGATFGANVISATPDHWFDANSVPPPGRGGYVFYATGATPGHNVSSSAAIGMSSGTLDHPVNYVTINTAGDQFLGSADAGNTQITIGGSAVTTGMAYHAPASGNAAQLATLTLGPGTPSIFRLGVLVDNVGGAANDIFWPTVTGLNGDVAGFTRGNNPPHNDIDLYWILSAHPGDIISVGATFRPGASNAAIGGFTFDLPVPGDANLDGTVNFADLLTLAQNYGQPNENWQHGDFNDDGTVNFSDLLILAQHYGQSLEEPPAAQVDAGSLAALPDPALCGPLAALAVLLHRRIANRPAGAEHPRA